MTWELDARADDALDPTAHLVRRPAPGKVTRTERLPWRAPAAPVQAAGAPAGDPAAIHAAAERGVRGGGGALPHADAIQRAFGHHDVSGVRAHVGGDAAAAATAIGARAYATGDAVAFGSAPDLRLAAHEAAHVVQQRGGVRLSGGVGAAGDEYERHADEVADRVVRGESAEALLDPLAHRGAAGGPAVQRVVGPDLQPHLTAVYAAVGAAAAAPGIFQFDATRNPSAPFDLARFADDAAAHDVAAPALPDGANPRLAGLRLDDPDYAEAGIGAINPLDPDHPTASITPGSRTESSARTETARRVFVAHRERGVAEQFGAGVTLVHVLAARALARDAAAASVAGAAEAAEAIRQRLFVASEYAAVDTLNPAESVRYEPDTGFTACNLYAYDLLRAMGVPEEALPTGRETRRAEDRGEAIISATGGNANANADQFTDRHDSADEHHDSSNHRRLMEYWDEIGRDADVAQREADQGRIVICLGRGTRFAGHVSVVLAENDHRDGAHAHRDADGRVDSTLESQAGGGDLADDEGRALPAGSAPGADGTRHHSANWNYDNRADRRARGAGSDRSPQWWREGHDGHFYRYRGGGVSGAADRTSYRLESETSMGMDYDARAAGAAVLPDGGSDGEPARVHAAAAAGVRGPTTRLPHADALQRAFGHHDLGGVQAHVGGAAAEASAAIGAQAYAYGDHVAFRGEPDLRQAAHEAAHVVQQRGGVRLDGGVGRAGDPYEQHADEVAAAVVRGDSAEALLDQHAHRGPGGGPAVQRLTRAERAAALAGAADDVTLEQLAHRIAYLDDVSQLSAADRAGLDGAGYAVDQIRAHHGAGDLQFWVFPRNVEAPHPATPVVAFRGSSSVGDLAEDGNREGIGMGQFTMNQALIQRELTAAGAGLGLIATGHSLGGAIAQIAACYYPDLIVSVTTFQAPGIPAETLARLRSRPRDERPVAHHVRVEGCWVDDAGDDHLPGAVDVYGTGTDPVHAHTTFPLLSETRGVHPDWMRPSTMPDWFGPGIDYDVGDHRHETSTDASLLDQSRPLAGLGGAELARTNPVAAAGLAGGALGARGGPAGVVGGAIVGAGGVAIAGDEVLADADRRTAYARVWTHDILPHAEAGDLTLLDDVIRRRCTEEGIAGEIDTMLGNYREMFPELAAADEVVHELGASARVPTEERFREQVEGRAGIGDAAARARLHTYWSHLDHDDRSRAAHSMAVPVPPRAPRSTDAAPRDAPREHERAPEAERERPMPHHDPRFSMTR